MLSFKFYLIRYFYPKITIGYFRPQFNSNHSATHKVKESHGPRLNNILAEFHKHESPKMAEYVTLNCVTPEWNEGVFINKTKYY